MDEPIIRPTSSDRGIVIGQTGAGKTYFMRQLLIDAKRLAVFDPKGTLNSSEASGGDWHLQPWDKRAVKALQRGVPYRVRIPNPLDGDWDRYFKRIYDAGNVMMYIDEIYGVVRPRRPIPYHLNAIYTRGRELGIGAWTASQRPTFIPLEIMSEAQWFVMFRVLLEEDRRRMAAVMGPQVIQGIEDGDDFGFWAYHVSWREPVYSAGLDVETEGAA
jgi:hypothetical protein